MAKKGKLKINRSVLDINILPDRYRRKKIRLLSILPWLLLAILLALLYPAVFQALQAEEEFQESSQAYQAIQATVENYTSLENEIETLESDLEAANQQLESFSASYSDFQLQSTNRSEQLDLILSAKPPGITLGNLVQQGGEIILEGSADAYQLPLEMVETLQSLERFSIVELNAIQVVISEQAGSTPVPSEEEQPPPTPTAVYTFQISIRSGDEEGQP